MGYHMPWMAWVPYLNTYAVGDATADLCGHNGKVGVYGKFSFPTALCRFWFVINIVLGIAGRGGGLYTSILMFAVSVFFSAGILATLMADLRDTDVSKEMGLSLAASIIPFFDVCYFQDTREELRRQKSIR